MNALLQNFISSRDALYDHCDFSEKLELVERKFE
jgi:hypothetical protein